MNIRLIKETCIYSIELEPLRQFYADVLGLVEIAYLPGKHIFSGREILSCCVLTRRIPKPKNRPLHTVSEALAILLSK